LRDLRNGRKLDHPNLSWLWQWNSFSGIALRAARDSGAVSYTKPDLISSYSLIYLQQDYVNSTALEILNEESKAGAALTAAGDSSNLTAAEIQTLLLKSAEIDLSFSTLQTTMKGLENMYLEEPQQRR
jgi:hypothetical protein